MTPAQFDAMARARGLPETDSRQALRAMLVDGLTAADAARLVGCSYPTAYRAMEKFRAWEALVTAAGYARPSTR